MLAPPDDVEPVLAGARAIGVVLDFVLLAVDAGGAPEALHHSAAVAAVTEASARRGLPASSVAGDLARGHRIDAGTFWGRRFDRERRRVLMIPSPAVLCRVARPPTGAVSGPLTWADQDDLDHLVWLDDDGHRGPWGFAKAFTQPPYRLRAPHAEVQELLRAVDDVVLGRVDDSAELWWWNGDWADYFDDGQEWWGAGAWTVRTALAPDRVVAICASATD